MTNRRYRRPKTGNFTVLIIGCVTALCFATIAAAQDGVQTRSITSDDFASQRPAKAKSRAKAKRYTYKFVRTDKNVARRTKPVAKPPAANLPAKVTEIGVTMWKMRPPRPGEVGFLIEVENEKGERKMWLAERVAADTVFRTGDKVRFAVESSDAGYLYVFGRETYADGSLGEPYPVFSGSDNDDNSVRPGMLVDIPDQREDLPYFKINPQKLNYTGERLTIIVSPKALTNLSMGRDGKLRDLDALTDLEIATEIEIFSRTDTADSIYSKTEADSACGVKTRELQREKSVADPCAAASRQLTREEPMPQSIYRVKGIAGQPAVAFVRLTVRN